MGKKNSKLKQDTIDRLTSATYCKYYLLYYRFSNGRRRRRRRPLILVMQREKQTHFATISKNTIEILKYSKNKYRFI